MTIKNNFLLFFLSLTISILSFSNAKAQSANTPEKVFIKIEIKGLACPYCAYGMEKALKKVAGIDKVDIELKTGLAYMSTPIAQKPTAESLEKIIVDGGFSVGDIEFSHQPFQKE